MFPRKPYCFRRGTVIALITVNLHLCRLANKAAERCSQSHGIGFNFSVSL